MKRLGPSPTRDLTDEVRRFVADFASVPAERVGFDTRLFGDLGIDGDDGFDLIHEFAERFQVELSSYEQERHFGPEGVLPWAPGHWLTRLFRRGTPETRARLVAITVGDLLQAARSGRWSSPPARVERG